MNIDSTLCQGRVRDEDGTEIDFVYLSLGDFELDVAMIENDFRPGSKVLSCNPIFGDDPEYNYYLERLTDAVHQTRSQSGS